MSPMKEKEAAFGRRRVKFVPAACLVCFVLGFPSPIRHVPQYLPLVTITKDPGPFPIPDRLKTQVNFWKKIFTEYTTQQVVIHDDWYINVEYEVIDISRSKFRTRKDAWKAVEATRKRYEQLLENLWNKDRELEKMTEEERRIYSLFKDIPESPRFRKQDAKNRVRAQIGLADKFMRGIDRAESFLDNMKRIFSLHGLPEELVCLAMVESAFDPLARSHLGASGIWQFMPRTGEEYNLSITYFMDERKDPFLSTLAATQLLAHNYEALRSWPLAITAYNHGLKGVLDAVEQIQPEDFADIVERYDGPRFGFASRNFYAEFLAALEVCNWYFEYCGLIESSKPPKLSQVRIRHYVAVETLEKYCQLSASDIRKLNPVLEPSVFKPGGLIPKHYKLNLLPEQKDAFESNYTSIPKSLKYKHVKVKAKHRVKKGQTLSKIAEMYNTSVERLKRSNALTNPRKIRPGQVLKIPGDYIALNPKKTPD